MYTKPVLTVQMYTNPVMTVQMYTKPVLTLQLTRTFAVAVLVQNTPYF